MNFFSSFLGRWNDITTPLYYITKRELYTIQYLLQEMLRSVENAEQLILAGLTVTEEIPDIPVDATRYALAVIGALPVFCFSLIYRSIMRKELQWDLQKDKPPIEFYMTSNEMLCER